VEGHEVVEVKEEAEALAIGEVLLGDPGVHRWRAEPGSLGAEEREAAGAPHGPEHLFREDHGDRALHLRKTTSTTVG